MRLLVVVVAGAVLGAVLGAVSGLLKNYGHDLPAGAVMGASGGLIVGVTALVLRPERHAKSRPR
jgi:hypothetical protein